MRYAGLVIKVCLLAYIVDQNRPQPKQLFFKKIEPKKIETAVFAIKTDRNQTSKLQLHRPTCNTTMTHVLYRGYILP